MDAFLQAALEQARIGLAEGGIPIGSVLVLDGKIVARGRNRRRQQSSPVLHAEIDCLRDAGRLQPSQYRRAILYSTLSPCDMCSGAILLYKIPLVVAGENRNFHGPEEYLRSRGVDVRVLDCPECYGLLRGFIEQHPNDWFEDIGEVIY
jgi:creatinine deaminase